MTLFELKQLGENKLAEHNEIISNPKQEAEDLLLYATKFTKAELFLKQKDEATETQKSVFLSAVGERIKGKPIAYITHKSEFFGNEFFVNEGCLIPRIDSEVLVEKAVETIKQQIKDRQIDENSEIKILDACCGTGCLGLSLANELKKLNQKFQLTLLDVSQSAIQVAKLNAQNLGIEAKFSISNVLYGLGFEKYNIILCNPPYIETRTIETLDKQVKDFEPRLALDGGEDGLKFYRKLATCMKKNMLQNAYAFLEIGYNQGKSISELFKNSGFDVEIVKDYGNQDRVVIIK